MKSLYVGNLSPATTESELRALFECHGKVDRVTIIADHETGQPRGFGFVEMSNASDAGKAVAALNGASLCGCALKVNAATPKTDRPRGGGKSFAPRDDYRGHARQPREPRW